MTSQETTGMDSQDRITGLACVNCNISLEEDFNSTKVTKIYATFGSETRKAVVNVFEAIALILNTPVDSSDSEEGITCKECGKLLELAYNSYMEFLSVSKPGSAVFALLEDTGRDSLTSQCKRITIKTDNDDAAGGNVRSRSVSRRKGKNCSEGKEVVEESSADLSRKRSKRKHLRLLELPVVTASSSKHDDHNLDDDDPSKRLPRTRRSSRLESISIEFGAEEFPEDEFRDDLGILEDAGATSSSSNSDKFNCRLCEDVRFNKYEDMKEHYTRLHPLISVWSQKEKEEGSGSQTQRGHTKLLFKCEVCEKRFPRHDHMTLHLRTHTGEKPYECSLCSKTFSDPRGLAYHEVTHSNDRPYCCTLCGQTFKRLHHLNDHEKNHRDTSRPFKCSTCGKSFKCKKHLKSHSVIHEDTKEHRCEVCRKAFNRKDNLRQHVKNVHAKKSLELSQTNKTSYLVLVNS